MEDLLKRITSNPLVSRGKLTIRNMRFTATQMLELLAAGMTEEEILQDYPFIEKADIQACLLYASRIANAKTITVISTAA